MDELLTGIDPDFFLGFDDEEVDDVIDISEAMDPADFSPVIRLVNLILINAIKRNVSDILLEPNEETLRIRYSIDGVLHEVMQPSIRLRDAIISRLKIMARLDIAKQHIPQEGTLKVRQGKGSETVFHASILPTAFGERLALQLREKPVL